MSEVHIFSIKKIILISLLLSLITLSILSTATVNKTDDNVDNKKGVQNSSSSQNSPTSTSSTTTSSSSTTSTSQSTSTSTNFSNSSYGTESSAPPQTTIAATQTSTMQQDNSYFETNVALETNEIARKSKDESSGIAFDSVKSSLIVNIFNYGLQVILIGLIFFALFTVIFVYAINSPEVVTYMNQALRLSGFKAKFTNIGKSITISPNSRIKIIGVNNLTIKIKLPIIGNPEEYGLRTNNDHVETECSIDSLPVKLQVIYLYLNQK